MPRFAALLLPLLLAGCDSANDVCAYLGSYAGTFAGDATGELTLTITEGEESDHAIAALTLTSDAFTAVGNGEVHCEDGELIVTLFDDAGAEIGTFTGSMIDEAGEWSLGTGESGTWDLAAQ